MVIYKPIIFMSKQTVKNDTSGDNNTINTGSTEVSSTKILAFLKAKLQNKKAKMDLFSAETRKESDSDILRIQAQSEYLCLQEMITEIEALIK